MKAIQANLLDQISSVLRSSGMDEQHARAAATAAAQRIRTGIDRHLSLMELDRRISLMERTETEKKER